MINAFYVLRESLSNFKKYAEGLSSNIEKGEEASDKGIFKLPEIYGGANLAAAGGAPAGGKKAAPPGKAPAGKAAAGKGKDDG